MSFSWISITAGETKIDDAHMNEVKTNVDTLASQLGISPYSWTVLPVSAGQKATAAQVTQLQTAIDYIDGENYCNTHYSTYNNGVDATHNNSRDVTHDVSADATHNGSYYNGYDVTVYATRLSTQDAAHYPGYYSAYYPSRLVGYDSSVCGGYYPSNLVSYNVGVDWVECDKQGGCLTVYGSHQG